MKSSGAGKRYALTTIWHLRTPIGSVWDALYAVEAWPQWWKYVLAVIELQKGDPELARGFLERAVKLDPQNYYAHYALGRSYQKLGRTDDANREFALQRSLRAEKHTAEEDTMEQMAH